MHVNHLYIFFGKMSLQVFYSFFSWVVCSAIELFECLFNLDIKSLSVMLFANIFFPIQ